VMAAAQLDSGNSQIPSPHSVNQACENTPDTALGLDPDPKEAFQTTGVAKRIQRRAASRRRSMMF